MNIKNLEEDVVALRSEIAQLQKQYQKDLSLLLKELKRTAAPTIKSINHKWKSKMNKAMKKLSHLHRCSQGINSKSGASKKICGLLSDIEWEYNINDSYYGHRIYVEDIIVNNLWET